jgi:hypothetical protein
LVTQSATQPALTNQTKIAVPSESLTSVVVLDQAGGGIVVRSVLDSSGASAVPVGSVSAGGGGTASRGQSHLDAVLSIAAFGAAAVLVLIGGVRRRKLRPSRP